MNILYIKNNEINRKKWDFCIENSCNGTIYAMSWFLDAVADNWDALIYGDYEIVMPITYVKRLKINILYTPDSIQQLGIFSKNKLSEQSLILFLKKLPKRFLFGKIQFNSANQFSAIKGFHLKNRVNIEQDICFPIEKIREKYGRNITENLRKARKNKITVRKYADFKATIELYRNNRGKERYYNGEKYYDSIYRLLGVMTQRKLLVVHEALKETGEVIAGIIAAPFKNRIVLLALGCNSDGYKTGATSILVDSILERFANQKEICDFEGSNTLSVATFYAGFGGHVVPYPEITVSQIPFWVVRLLYNIKRK